MRAVDEEFRIATGLREKGEYKIYYSHIHAFPLLVLGQNPGGSNDGPSYVASESYFENWEHDFVHFRNTPAYALARPMCDLLEAVLETSSEDVLRQVPVTNVIFRRSPNTETLAIRPLAAARESQAALNRIVQYVAPRAILFISKTAYDLFVKLHCRPGSVQEKEVGQVFTPNGSNQACIFLHARGVVDALQAEIELLVVGHPSKYSGRAEWPLVLSSLREVMQEMGISPIERTEALRELPASRAASINK
jgi:hypothetical protein